MNSTPSTLSLAQLETITGGAGSGSGPGPAPVVRPMPTPNMGFPKYSAGWWDLVRSRGLGK